MATSLLLSDADSRRDLRSYLQRLERAGQREVRMLTRGSVLAVYGCTQAPRGITDQLPVVLVMRAFALLEEPSTPVDVTVEGRSLTDRIARMESARDEVDQLSLDVPDVTAMAAWTGVLPPLGGWVTQGRIDPGSLTEVANTGIQRVADLLPDNPGEAVVHTVRSTVWNIEVAPGVPSAAAFAAETMGFLDEEPVVVSRSLTWIRLSTRAGHVLVRSLTG